MKSADIRAYLQAIVDGSAHKPRGNALDAAAVNAAAPFARACRALAASSYHGEIDARVSPPSEALPPLP